MLTTQHPLIAITTLYSNHYNGLEKGPLCAKVYVTIKDQLSGSMSKSQAFDRAYIAIFQI